MLMSFSSLDGPLLAYLDPVLTFVVTMGHHAYVLFPHLDSTVRSNAY